MIVQHLSLTPRILLLPSLLLLFLVERERTGNVFEIHRIRCDPLFSLPFRFTVQIGRVELRRGGIEIHEDRLLRRVSIFFSFSTRLTRLEFRFFRRSVVKKKKKRERKKRKIIHAPRFEQFASLNVPRIFLFSLSFFLPTDIHSSRDSTSLFNVSMNGLVIHSSRRRSSLSIHSSSSSSSFVTSFEIRSACAQKSKTYRNGYPPLSS